MTKSPIAPFENPEIGYLPYVVLAIAESTNSTKAAALSPPVVSDNRIKCPISQVKSSQVVFNELMSIAQVLHKNMKKL